MPNTNRNTESNNRAEEIRRRRTTRTQQRVENVSHRVNHPVQTRPVIVRGGGGFGNAGTPIHRQVGTRPRRQFYVAMDAAGGSELRLPAIPMINLGWRAISALIVVLAAIGAFSLLNSPFFQVYTVDVQGLERLNGADLQAILRLENQSIIEVKPAEVQEKIAVSFPELADVNVRVGLPNVVTVSARERQPLLAWQTGDSTRWIDAEGYVFPARGDAGPLVTVNTSDEIPLAPLTEEENARLQEMIAESPYLASTTDTLTSEQADVLGGILQTNAAFTRKADMALLNASLQLTKMLPEGTAIVFDKLNGLGWTDPKGYQVYIGKDLTNFDVKFKLYQSIAATLETQGIQPTLISVEHLNEPFYRTAQEVSREQ